MLTVIHCVVAPVLQRYVNVYPIGAAAAHHCVELPEQTDPLPVIEQTGLGRSVTVLVHELVHPFPSVIVIV